MSLTSAKMILSIGVSSLENLWVSTRSFFSEYAEAKVAARKRNIERRESLEGQLAEDTKAGIYHNTQYYREGIAAVTLDGGRGDIAFWLQQKKFEVDKDTAQKTRQIDFTTAANSLEEA